MNFREDVWFIIGKIIWFLIDGLVKKNFCLYSIYFIFYFRFFYLDVGFGLMKDLSFIRYWLKKIFIFNMKYKQEEGWFFFGFNLRVIWN